MAVASTNAGMNRDPQLSGQRDGTGVPGLGLDLETSMNEEAQRDTRLSYIHPGETLREDFLAPLGKSPAWLAEGLRLPLPEVVEILAGLRPITASTALRLSRFLGCTPEFWLGLQAGFDLEVAADSLTDELGAIDPYPMPHLVAEESQQTVGSALPIEATAA
jgi:antitoxin HigA-1